MIVCNCCHKAFTVLQYSRPITCTCTVTAKYWSILLTPRFDEKCSISYLLLLNLTVRYFDKIFNNSSISDILNYAVWTVTRRVDISYVLHDMLNVYDYITSTESRTKRNKFFIIMLCFQFYSWILFLRPDDAWQSATS